MAITTLITRCCRGADGVIYMLQRVAAGVPLLKVASHRLVVQTDSHVKIIFIIFTWCNTGNLLCHTPR